ncbi:MAG: hypothetical protein AAFQ98_02520 [Bacteroidota bacterium]
MIFQEAVHYYTEYEPDLLIKQPWNAITSLFFFIPVAYWGLKLKGRLREFPILFAILPLAFLNGVGSTLWHANDGGMVFGLLDALPPMVMMLILTTYFWKFTLGKWWQGILIMIGFLAVNIGIMAWAFQSGSDLGVNLYYVLMGLMVTIPIVLVLVKTQGQGWQQIVLTVIFLLAALTFRMLDNYPNPNPFPETLPQGTHFLWHLVSVGAYFPLGYFLIFLQNFQDKQQPLAESIA